jgi:hypothetical protein
MLSWIIQITIISIIFIFLVHHLINFFKSTLTIPKIKDLVNSPNKKYENIFDTIKNNSNNNLDSNSNNYSLIDLLPQTDKPTMKNELKNFLKKQFNNSSMNSTEISSLDSMSNLNSYYEFK